MKTLEDLESMTVAQLKGIAVGLGASVSAKITKPKLVQLVHDIQQPEVLEGDDKEVEADVSKPITTEEDLTIKLEAIAEHFGGAIGEAGEDEAGVMVYVVTDLAGDDLHIGSYLELQELVDNAPAPNEAVDLDKIAGVGDNGDIPDDPDYEEVITETPDVADGDNLAEIEKGLKVLQSIGLKYRIEGSVVEFTFGSKVISTTLNQPAYRVVRTAEQLCNFR